MVSLTHLTAPVAIFQHISYNHPMIKQPRLSNELTHFQVIRYPILLIPRATPPQSKINLSLPTQDLSGARIAIFARLLFLFVPQNLIQKW